VSKIVKLTSEHYEAVKPLFYNSKKYMGITDPAPFFESAEVDLSFNEKLHDIFCNQYLSDLTTFHAFGLLDDNGNVLAFSTFYESHEEPCWFYTMYRGSGDHNHAVALLDKMIEYNESNGRLRYYTLVNARHAKLLRRFSYSSYNNERYDYFDDIIVPKDTRCFYSKYWQILFRRSLIPTDTVIRCSFLKQQHRTGIPIGGSL
jgi:hypothetical protein